MLELEGTSVGTCHFTDELPQAERGITCLRPFLGFMPPSPGLSRQLPACSLEFLVGRKQFVPFHILMKKPGLKDKDMICPR